MILILNQTFGQSINQTTKSIALQNNDEYLYFFENLREITGLYLFPFIGVAGIVGNILIVIVYSKAKKYSTNVYLITMASSDILKLANDLIYFLVTLITKLNPILGEQMFFILYRYSHYIFVFTSLNTSWLTCAITIDRYFAVVKHNTRKIKSNYLQSFLICMTIYVCSAIGALPSPFFNETIQEYDSKQNKTLVKMCATKLGKSNFKSYYQFAQGLVRAVLPLILLVYLNICIINVLVKTKMKNVNRQRNRRITMMLCCIVIIFVICIFPDCILSMMHLGYVNESSLIRGIREITDLLLEINSASTFPICYYFSLQFRIIFKQLFTNEPLLSKSITNNNQNNLNNNKNSIVRRRLKADRRRSTCGSKALNIKLI